MEKQKNDLIFPSTVSIQSKSLLNSSWILLIFFTLVTVTHLCSINSVPVTILTPYTYSQIESSEQAQEISLNFSFYTKLKHPVVK